MSSRSKRVELCDQSFRCGQTVRGVEELAEFSPTGVLVEINAYPPGGTKVGRHECSAVFQEGLPVTGPR